MLAEAAALIGDPQVRNQGTIEAPWPTDPAADYPATVLALDAEIDQGPRGGARCP